MKEQNKHFCYYIVAFFDLLGQKELLKRFKKLPDKSNESEIIEFEESFRRTFGRVNSLSKSFKSYFKTFYNLERRSVFGWLFRSAGVKIQRFSDGCVIFMPLMDTGDNIPVAETTGVLLACGSVFIAFLIQGIPIRGSIDVGLGFEMNDNEIYGPVVAQAAFLENDIAQYPRIVIGDCLYDYLVSAIVETSTNNRSEIAKKTAEKGLELIVRDHDGYPILDYMGRAFGEATGNLISKKDYLKVYDFVKREQMNWQNVKNSKLAFRYRLMLNYIEARLF